MESKGKGRVFLGGTCAGSIWRDQLIKVLQVEYFNPVVADWTPAAQAEEAVQKQLCNVHLYVITKDMTGVFSIAEAVDSACTAGKLTILHVIPEGFAEPQLKSLVAVCDLVRNRGGIAYVDDDLMRTARILNFAMT